MRWGTPEQSDDDVSGSGAYTHMTLLSETTEGMHNLFRLSSRASMEGYYFKPRMDRELLQTYSKGLIATTGCPGGEVQTRLRLGQYDAARAAAAEFQDIFGKENYFAEIMDHGLAVERRVMSDLLKIAKDLDIPLVGTNDLHYTHQHDAGQPRGAAVRAVRLDARRPEAVQVRRRRVLRQDARRDAPDLPRHPEACDNTLLIAERCEVEFNTAANYMPRFPVPDGETEDSWFVKEVEVGLHERYPARHPRRRCARRPSTRPASSRRWASPATSSSSPTSSTGPSATASASDRVAARAPARWPPTRWGSPTSTRCSTA